MLDDKVKLKIQDILKEKFEAIKINPFQKRIIRPPYFYSAIIFIITGAPLLICGILIWMNILIHANKKIGLILLSTGSVLSIISLIYGIQFTQISMKYKSINTTQLSYNIYSILLKDHNIDIESLTLIPDCPYQDPLYSRLNTRRYFQISNKTYYNNWFINGFYTKNKNKIKFSIGSITIKEVHSNGKSSSTYYFNVGICNFDIKNAEGFKTSIKKEYKIFSKKLNRKEQTQGLESKEFETIYKLEYDQPIKLRKFLEPRIMLQMIELKDTYASTPTFHIDDNKMSLYLKRKNQITKNNYRYILFRFATHTNETKYLNAVLDKAGKDIKKMEEIFQYIKLFNDIK